MKKFAIAMCIALMVVSAMAVVGCLDGATQKSDEGTGGPIKQAGSLACQATIKQLESAIDNFYSMEGESPQSLQDLVDIGFIEEIPTCSEGGKYRLIKGDPPGVECTIKEHNVD